MTDENEAVTDEEICPYLGLAAEPSIRFFGATPSHRCYCGPIPRAISTAQQDAHCLSAGHQQCLRWSMDAEGAEPEEVTDLLDSEPEEPRRQWVPRLLTGSGSVLFAVLILVGSILVVPLLEAAKPGAGPEAGYSRTSSGGPSLPVRPERLPPSETWTLGPPSESGAVSPPGGAPSASQTGPTSTPVTKPTTGTIPSRAPTAVPTLRKAPATPVPAGRLHVVQKKDTLYSLAKAYGVTVEEIVGANGLKSSAFIRLGQTLVIPQPRTRS